MSQDESRRLARLYADGDDSAREPLLRCLMRLSETQSLQLDLQSDDMLVAAVKDQAHWLAILGGPVKRQQRSHLIVKRRTSTDGFFVYGGEPVGRALCGRLVSVDTIEDATQASLSENLCGSCRKNAVREYILRKKREQLR